VDEESIHSPIRRIELLEKELWGIVRFEERKSGTY